jgi:hypothetical protein
MAKCQKEGYGMKNNREKDPKHSVAATTAALFKKLPVIKTYCEPDIVGKVSFHRIDMDVLRQSCGYTEGEMDRNWMKRVILLLGKDGRLIGQVGVRTIPKQIRMRINLWVAVWTPEIPSHNEYFE